MRTRLFTLAALFGLLGHAEIIDRIAVTIGNRVLTESMLIEQIRLSALYDGREPDFSPASKRAAAETLIAQTLLLQEMDDTRYPEPAMKDVIDELRNDVVPLYEGEAGFPNALRARRVTEEELQRFVQRMMRSLSFIDLRFRRGQTVTTDEIRQYYEGEFRQVWMKKNAGKPIPALEDVTEEIEEVIVGRKTDKALEEWVAQARQRSEIRFRDEVFQ
ncbi:MAG: hypothetical protein JNK87_25215 [Bryobacterales bacterium]|nr:hypothetical protein [Bryobacterales bacterium]